MLEAWIEQNVTAHTTRWWDRGPRVILHDERVPLSFRASMAAFIPMVRIVPPSCPVDTGFIPGGTECAVIREGYNRMGMPCILFYPQTNIFRPLHHIPICTSIDDVCAAGWVVDTEGSFHFQDRDNPVYHAPNVLDSWMTNVNLYPGFNRE